MRFSNIDEWCSSLEARIQECAQDVDQKQENKILREIAEDFRAGPVDVIALLGAVPNATDIAILLDVGASETLAARLVGQVPLGMILSRSPEGLMVCTLADPDTGHEAVLAGHSEPLVRVGTMAKFILALVDPSRSLEV